MDVAEDGVTASRARRRKLALMRRKLRMKLMMEQRKLEEQIAKLEAAAGGGGGNELDETGLGGTGLSGLGEDYGGGLALSGGGAGPSAAGYGKQAVSANEAGNLGPRGRRRRLRNRQQSALANDEGLDGTSLGGSGFGATGGLAGASGAGATGEGADAAEALMARRRAALIARRRAQLLQEAAARRMAMARGGYDDGYHEVEESSDKGSMWDQIVRGLGCEIYSIGAILFVTAFALWRLVLRQDNTRSFKGSGSWPQIVLHSPFLDDLADIVFQGESETDESSCFWRES